MTCIRYGAAQSVKIHAAGWAHMGFRPSSQALLRDKELCIQGECGLRGMPQNCVPGSTSLNQHSGSALPGHHCCWWRCPVTTGFVSHTPCLAGPAAEAERSHGPHERGAAGVHLSQAAAPHLLSAAGALPVLVCCSALTRVGHQAWTCCWSAMQTSVRICSGGSEQSLSRLLPGLCSCLVCRTVPPAPQCTGCVLTAGDPRDQHVCFCQPLARFAGGQHSGKGEQPDQHPLLHPHSAGVGMSLAHAGVPADHEPATPHASAQPQGAS